MASDSSVATSSARVPAWKKIGLKLKNASETLPEVKATSTKRANGTHINDDPRNDHASETGQTPSISKSTTLAIRSPEGRVQSHENSKKSKKRKVSEADDASAAVSPEVDAKQSSR